MGMIGSRRLVGGLVAVVLAVGCVFGVLAASGGAAGSAKPAAAATLGRLTALAWGVQTPVGARLVLRPSVSFNLPPRALRMLHATKPRLNGRFVARIVTTPARGRSRTVVVVSRRDNSLALLASAAHSILGRRLRLPQWVLTRKQTQAVKRAAARSPLALTLSARYRVSYTNARGRTVLTPTRSGSVTLPVALKPQQARGGNLRNLAVSFRGLLGQAGQLKTACVTRNMILEELRNTYSTMVSGDRTGAAGLLQTYERYADVRRAAGLLNHQQASMLASRLGGLLKRVGGGQSKRVESPRRWPALPNCGPVRAHHAQTLATIIIARIAAKWLVMKIVRFPIKRTRKAIGRTVRDSRNAEYPEDTSQPSLTDAVPAGDPTSAQPVLDDLKVQMDNYTSLAQCCLSTQPSSVADAWQLTMNNFAFNRWRFEPSTAHYSLNDELQLLPLFAQYINMYLTMLNEGVVYGHDWGLTPDATASLEDKVRAELNPNGPSSGCTGSTCPGGDAMSYSKRVYDAGLAKLGSSTDPQTNFAKTNEYKREMQISVLDMRDQWHVQDPMGYPYGDPSFKLDRMIYSDAVGTTTQTFAAPANVTNPLSAITAWTTRVTVGSYTNRNWLTAIQANGARTGATSTGTPTTYNGAPGSTLGPVVQVDTTWDQKSNSSQKVIGTVRFHFSDGTTAAPGGDFYDRGTCNSTPPCTTSWTFENEVLATAKIMGSYQITTGTYVGDSMVLGFRPADSFSPQWHGSLPGALRAPNTQACLGVTQVTLTSGGTTGSRADGAPLQMRNCSSTAWDQTWQYIDYNDPNDPESAAAQHELTVYAGSKCAAPKDGATATGTPVQVYGCDETPPQKWTRHSDGTITNDQSGLCLERAGGAVSNGTPLQLNTCNSSDAQNWNWP